MQKYFTIRNVLIGADLILVAVTGFLYRRIPPEVPLYYSKPWGDQQLADNWQLIMLPFLMHLFVLGNMFVAKKWFSEVVVVQKMMFWANIVTIALFTFVSIKILSVVT